MVDPESGLPDWEELHPWLVVEDQRLARRGVSISWRALELWPKLQLKFGLYEALGPGLNELGGSAHPLLDMLNQWYDAMWGQRAKGMGRPFHRLPVILREEVFEYDVPLFFGDVGPVRLTDYLTGATEHLIRDLSDDELGRIRYAFEHGPPLVSAAGPLFVFRRTGRMRWIHRLRLRCKGDRELAMDALVGQVDLAASVFWSREHAEKALKIFLAVCGAVSLERLKTEFRHDLSAAFEACAQIDPTFTGIADAVGRLAEIRSGIRFHSKAPRTQEACEIHWRGLEVAAHCGRQLRTKGKGM